MTITVERVREALAYNSETGVFTWLQRTSTKVHIGDEAGSPSNGYWSIKLDHRNYGAHILAWLWMTGAWPTHEVDHIDGVRDNNRWINLRDGSDGVNKRNIVAPNKNNPSGYRGVSRSGRRWAAHIKVNGKQQRLGTFDTPEDAHVAYMAAKAELHGEDTYRARLG